jgi:tartrate-resistant acid phosphatase type 5
MCLGNHDIGYIQDNSQIQIEYQKHSKKWKMPNKHYKYGNHLLDVFVMDTNLMNLSKKEKDSQKLYLMNSINKSKKKWKILVGHHTWRSLGEHGNSEDPELEILLNYIVNNSDIDAYMCGHDHCKIFMMKKMRNREIPIIVCGTGSEEYSWKIYHENMKPNDSEMLFFSRNLGVCVLDITKNKIEFSFRDELNNEEFTYTLS